MNEDILSDKEILIYSEKGKLWNTVFSLKAQWVEGGLVQSFSHSLIPRRLCVGRNNRPIDMEWWEGGKNSGIAWGNSVKGAWRGQ